MSKKNSVTRRDFLKGTAVGALAVAGGAALTGCSKGSAVSSLPEKWDKETDVVIIGFGGAGAMAAITALEAGAEVVILEKREVAGGSTAICGGVYYASNTSVQKANGIEDSADKMYEHYINAGKGFNDPKLVRLACDNSAANVEKLIELGGEFNSAPTVAGAEYHVGSEPIARVHSISYGELGGGAAYFAVLENGAKSKGAEIMLETPALSLVVNDAKEVVGVKADNLGTEIFIKARKAVILTSGGFTRDQQMLHDYSQQGFYCQPLGAPGLTGDGHRMAFALGAGATNITEVLGVPGLTLPGMISATYALWTFIPTLPGLLINNRGFRFVNEFSFYDWSCTELLKQPDKYCFTVFDAKMRDAGAGMIVAGFSADLEAEVADGQVLKADSLAELAELMEIPAAAFEQNIAKWNEDAAAGTDTIFGRATGLEPLDTAPYYAFKTFPTTFDNSGGLKIDENAQVIDVWGNPIARLYAAGQVAGGVIGEHYPGSGTALNAGLTFGKIAGETASKLENWG